MIIDKIGMQNKIIPIMYTRERFVKSHEKLSVFLSRE